MNLLIVFLQTLCAQWSLWRDPDTEQVAGLSLTSEAELSLHTLEINTMIMRLLNPGLLLPAQNTRKPVNVGKRRSGAGGPAVLFAAHCLAAAQLLVCIVSPNEAVCKSQQSTETSPF